MYEWLATNYYDLYDAAEELESGSHETLVHEELNLITTNDSPNQHASIVETFPGISIKNLNSF